MLLKDCLGSVDLSTRAKRRRAASLAVCLLKRIRLAEEESMGRIPANLQGCEAYSNADLSVDAIIDAVAALEDAY
jgi:hypothetical protein